MKSGTAVLRPAAHEHRPAVLQTRLGTLRRLSHFVVEYVLALPAGALLALVWANTDPESYFRLVHPAGFWVNDVLMVAFFALVTKEIVEATVPGGVLHPWHKATLPVVAAGGVTLTAAVVFAATVRAFDDPMLAQGWPVVFAVDLAAVFFIARVIFGSHPAVPFLLLLGIAANGAGFVVLAFRQPPDSLDAGGAALLMGAAVAFAAALRKYRVNTFWPYVLVSGVLSWWALFRAGLHPVFALVPILPFLPHAARDPGFFVDARRNARDALNQLELWFRAPAQLALFLFGLVNAGVPLRWVESGVWALPLSAAIARPIGLLTVVAIAVFAGLRLPARIGWRELVVIATISGTGFTMALFFATTLLGPGQLLSEMKVSTLLTVVPGVAAIPLAWLLGRTRSSGK